MEKCRRFAPTLFYTAGDQHKAGSCAATASWFMHLSQT
jgi:flavin reductase (DIM6/NTAB) family NADH-FMN oxidoreductase RutF